MKKALNAPVRMWQLVLVSVLVAILTSTAAVSAAPLSTFLAAGTVRMAFASGTDVNAINVPTSSANTIVLKTTISIPAGKVADVAVIGSVGMAGGALTGYEYCFGGYQLDSGASAIQFKPGTYILEGFNPPAINLTVPINGYLVNVSAGSHTVYMLMHSSYADCLALNRSMIVLANIH